MALTKEQIETFKNHKFWFIFDPEFYGTKATQDLNDRPAFMTFIGTEVEEPTWTKWFVDCAVFPIRAMAEDWAFGDNYGEDLIVETNEKWLLANGYFSEDETEGDYQAFEQICWDYNQTHFGQRIK
ncbi:hypothetical protein ATX69_02490 [Oenococcus oeni]|uniref:hypothetical protein n=1 Tax=Oenococcus oeni TaxID=1247 RepID=UPI0008F92E61|nr:hypothetical protein [Oenococcus oeni]OIM34191.1 hypothetical protein ATX69_02490 [Oenococcus oeni]